MSILRCPAPNVHDSEATREEWIALVHDLRHTDTYPDEAPELDLASTWEPSQEDADWWAAHSDEDVILDNDIHPFHAGEGVSS